MEPITSDTILVLAGSFLCVFLSLVTVGGLYLFWRTKQEQSRGAPHPPPVTRDVHAEPLAEMPTRHDEQDTTAPPPPPALPSRTRPTRSLDSMGDAENTLAESTETLSRPKLTPLGLDLDEDFDEGGETTTRNIPVAGFTPLVLPQKSDNDTTPTVIIDRSQPMIDDDEEL